MSVLSVLLGIGLLFAAIAGVLSLANLRRYRAAPSASDEGSDGVHVSVCIPARNEAANIEACVRSLLGSTHGGLEVLVYDDQSDDDTATIVRRVAAEDDRVKLVSGVELPAGWNGKQHACWRLAQASTGDWLLFTDADVRFEPDAVSRSLAQATRAEVGLLSTVPRQIVGSLGEGLLVPMIHFLLMSYLPMGRMRSTLDPAASAGCGQFLLVRRDAYEAFGGHEAFRASMHDGVRMPRAARNAGVRTDIFDGTDLCHVRMYDTSARAWRGFAKNAFEGLGSVGLLCFLTAMHLLGHILPWAVLLGGLAGAIESALTITFAGAIVAMNLVQRLALSRRFRQPLWPAFAHPLGVIAMTLVQWHSLALDLMGRRAWRGRPGVSGAATQ